MLRESELRRPPMVHGLARDVAERLREREEGKELRERLHRAEKMAALGRVTGGVAHDLNNILGVASLYSELLRAKLPEESPLRAYAGQIFTSMEKAAALLQDLLTLSGKDLPALRRTNLNDVVSATLKTPEFESIRTLHPEVNFKTTRGWGVPEIEGSTVHLEKSLINLVSHAVETISGAGEVTIGTECRVLDGAIGGHETARSGDYAILSVSDTGMGLSDRDAEKIFEPFHTKKGMGRGGTGLELAVVRQIVNDHQGYIDLRNRIGEGTTFTLYFPAARTERIAKPQNAAAERCMERGESILIAGGAAGPARLRQKGDAARVPGG